MTVPPSDEVRAYETEAAAMRDDAREGPRRQWRVRLHAECVVEGTSMTDAENGAHALLPKDFEGVVTVSVEEEDV